VLYLDSTSKIGILDGNPAMPISWRIDVEKKRPVTGTFWRPTSHGGVRDRQESPSPPLRGRRGNKE
jgi:hypothetical protein